MYIYQAIVRSVPGLTHVDLRTLVCKQILYLKSPEKKTKKNVIKLMLLSGNGVFKFTKIEHIYLNRDMWSFRLFLFPTTHLLHSRSNCLTPEGPPDPLLPVLVRVPG